MNKSSSNSSHILSYGTAVYKKKTIVENSVCFNNVLVRQIWELVLLLDAMDICSFARDNLMYKFLSLKTFHIRSKLKIKYMKYFNFDIL